MYMCACGIFYPEHVKNSNNSIIQKTPFIFFLMGKRFEPIPIKVQKWSLYRKRYSSSDIRKILIKPQCDSTS